MTYTIEEHKHRYSAWAASRAASVKSCRFKVSDGKAILEEIAIAATASTPANLPGPDRFDAVHRNWREATISAANHRGLTFTHGVAAKLINVYLKGILICGGHDSHPNIAYLHPPIDALLLAALDAENFGNLRKDWKAARNQRWSNFTSSEYETVMSAIRQSMDGKPLWQIEKFWRGHQ